MATQYPKMSLAAASALIASAGGAIVFGPSGDIYHDPRPYTPPRKSPNDDGPVIDTTRESKRAKRRRLAKPS